jgi:hypothetical protein
MEKKIELLNNDSYLYVNIILLLLASIITVNDFQTNFDSTSDDPHRNTNNETYSLLVSSMTTIIIILYIVFYLLNDGVDKTNKYMYYYLAVAALVGIYMYLKINNHIVIKYAGKTILILMGIILVAMIIQLFFNYFKSLQNAPRYIHILLVIPCLVLDFVKYISNEFTSTPSTIFILFGVELILLLLYLYLPSLLDKIKSKDGEVIVKDYVYLNKENIYPIEEYVLMDTKNIKVADTENDTVRKKYSISMWLYLNNYSTSVAAYNKESLIFDYGSGKPKITYFNNDDKQNEMDIYRFYFTNTTDECNSKNLNYYEVNMPSQKWNNIVFNYNSTYVDLYINGKLERTFYFEKHLPTFSLYDTITVGSDNGLSGALSNARYYKNNLSSREIINNYNMLMNKNPPVNNL